MCIIAYSTMYWFIFQTRLCILLHISNKIVYIASYFRQDCVFSFIFQTRLCIFLHIADKIVYFASYIREDYVLCFIFRQDCVFSFIFQTRLCIFLHISDKIVYFPSYFRQDCVFSFIFQTRLYIWCLSCRFQLRCWLYLLSLVYIWSSWKVSKISNHLPMYSVSISYISSLHLWVRDNLVWSSLSVAYTRNSVSHGVLSLYPL
jgi:hypothetical protein